MTLKEIIDMNMGPNGWIRRGYELKHLFLGRPIRPFHLAVMISTGTVAHLLLVEHVEDGFAYILLGILALLSSSMLFLGWWVKPEWSWNEKTLSEWGLLLAVGVWLSRSIYVLISGGSGVVINPTASAFLSVAWAIGAGGAYLLERYDHVMEGGESE